MPRQGKAVYGRIQTVIECISKTFFEHLLCVNNFQAWRVEAQYWEGKEIKKKKKKKESAYNNKYNI